MKQLLTFQTRLQASTFQ